MAAISTTEVVQTPAVAEIAENPSFPEVALEDRLVTVEDALAVVEHEVEREQLLTDLQERDLFAKLPSPNSENLNAETIASNVFREFKGIDLRGVDASAVRFLNSEGKQVPIADFILGLNQEEAKDFFQGTVYDEGTKFSTDEGKDSEGLTKNERVHKLLESISSEYKGGSELTDIQALVEPAETRFRRLLGPSEAGSRSNEVEVALNTPRVVGVPDSWSSLQQEVQSNKSAEGGEQGADSEEIVASGEEKTSNSTITEQSNADTSVTNHSTAVAQHDDELAEELRKFIKLSAQERVDKIKKLVEPEEDSGDAYGRIGANQKAIELVKGWLTSQLVGDGFGVIVRAVESRDAENGASEADNAERSNGSDGEENPAPQPAQSADTEFSRPNEIKNLVEAYNSHLHASGEEPMHQLLGNKRAAFGVDITKEWESQVFMGRSGGAATLEVATNGSYRVFEFASNENYSHILLPTKQTMRVISNTGQGNGIFEFEKVPNLTKPQLKEPAIIEPNSNDNKKWKVTTRGIIQIPA